MIRTHHIAALLLMFAGGCEDVEDPDHDHDHDHENEVFTTVGLTFTPLAGGADLEFTWADPENDGDPVVDTIMLPDADDYDLSVTFLNELEDPAEDVTPEIEDEADEHQVFFTGSAVMGPATGANAEAIVEHAYADMDEGGLPLGLDNMFSTMAVGTGQLTVTLRHMPAENGEPVKVSGLAESVATGGFGTIGGNNDIEVTFDIEVQ